MHKIKFVIIYLFICLSASFAQKKTIAIGLNYEQIVDTDRGYQYDQSITASYSTKRERLALEALYGLSTRLYTKSAIGISFYNSELTIGRLMNPCFSGIHISNPYLVVSQTVLYDIVQFPSSGFLKIKVSPFLKFDYEHLLSKMENAKGFSDLASNEAVQFIAEFSIPALGAKTKSPIGIFSVAGGLSFEVILYKKMGVYYNFGYSHSLFGHSMIDAKYKYIDNEIHALNCKSKDSGFLQKIGLRYYY